MSGAVTHGDCRPQLKSLHASSVALSSFARLLLGGEEVLSDLFSPELRKRGAHVCRRPSFAGDISHKKTITRTHFNVGATRAANNTGEMQGVFEAPLWLKTCVEQDSAVMIAEDSLHVKGLVGDKFVARGKQGARYTAATHVASDGCNSTFAGCVENTIADRLAECGTQPPMCTGPHG